MKALISLAAGLSLVFLMPVLAQTEPQSSLSAPGDLGIISIQSSHSVKVTADRLEQQLRAKGFKLYQRLDYQTQADSVKLALRPSILLIFADPKTDTLLMHENETLGLDLPHKFLIWQTADQAVFISWNNSYYLAQRHGLPLNFAPLSSLSQHLVQMAKKAAAKN